MKRTSERHKEIIMDPMNRVFSPTPIPGQQQNNNSSNNYTTTNSSMNDVPSTTTQSQLGLNSIHLQPSISQSGSTSYFPLLPPPQNKSSSSSSPPSPFSLLLLTCPICSKQLSNPHILPCLHVFCLNCLRDECRGKSSDKYFCPSCVLDTSSPIPSDPTADTQLSQQQVSQTSRAWHIFEKVLEQETEHEELQRRRAELPESVKVSASLDYDNDEYNTNDDNDDDDDDDNNSEENQINSAGYRKQSLVLEPPLLFPCTIHADRLADTFCSKCSQLACPKCVSSFHRRCQDFNTLEEAVDSRRSQFASIHDKMAANLVTCEEIVDFQTKRRQKIEEMRTETLIQIKKFRTDLVNMILAKEKVLTKDVNQIFDDLTIESSVKNETTEKLAKSLRRQMELLDLSFSFKGEAELLPLLQGLSTRINNDAMLIQKQGESNPLSKISFMPDLECRSVLESSPLGKISIEGSVVDDSQNSANNDVIDLTPDLHLELITSFHGGTRDDTAESLLADLIVVSNGDVILTDRDNRCVKKFNQQGNLLTRVVLDAVPSRIATVSHARAVVSVINKKRLYFLSLFGTVRILHTVRVKKLYSFLTSLGDSVLAAGTYLCDSIDLINEKGETIRNIFAQKPEKSPMARPLYLTSTIPVTSSGFKRNESGHAANSNLVNTSKSDSNSSNETHHQTQNDQKSTTISNQSTSNHSNFDHNKSQKGGNERSSAVTANNIKVNHLAANQNRPSSSSSSTSPSSKLKSSSSSTTTKKSVKGGQPHHNNNASSSTSSHFTHDTRRASLPISEQQNHSKGDSTTASSHHKEQSISSSPSLSSSSPPTPLEQGILISDSGKRVVFRLEKDSTVTFTLKSNNQLKIECPLGITVHHETGLALVADRDSDCVLLLDKNGNFLRKVLTSDIDGLSKPIAIYADAKGHVVLTQVDGMIKIYKSFVR